jgi:hypothetical protein
MTSLRNFSYEPHTIGTPEVIAHVDINGDGIQDEIVQTTIELHDVQEFSQDELEFTKLKTDNAGLLESILGVQDLYNGQKFFRYQVRFGTTGGGSYASNQEIGDGQGLLDVSLVRDPHFSFKGENGMVLGATQTITDEYIGGCTITGFYDTITSAKAMTANEVVQEFKKGAYACVNGNSGRSTSVMESATQEP